MRNSDVKFNWLSFILDSATGEEIATLLIRIRAMLLRAEVREYLDNMQEIDSLLLDLACYFADAE